MSHTKFASKLSQVLSNLRDNSCRLIFLIIRHFLSHLGTKFAIYISHESHSSTYFKQTSDKNDIGFDIGCYTLWVG